MTTYKRGDYVKVEIVNENAGESEWLWVRVDHCDDENRIIFGRLDNVPIVNTDLQLGQELAVSFDNVKEHKSDLDFK